VLAGSAVVLARDLAFAIQPRISAAPTWGFGAQGAAGDPEPER
jgi:hypothetical protein